MCGGNGKCIRETDEDHFCVCDPGYTGRDTCEKCEYKCMLQFTKYNKNRPTYTRINMSVSELYSYTRRIYLRNKNEKCRVVI